MGLRGTVSLLSTLVLVTACATSTTRMTPAERLEFYRAHAGEPVRSFHSPGRLWGWRAIGDSALTVWTNSNRGFLLELAHRCPDMAFATSIGLTTRTGRVSAGFDSVVVQRSGVPGSTIQNSAVQTRGVQRGVQNDRTLCRIDTIRPLNTRVVKESKSDLQDADLVERDPSEPDAPEEPQ
ncbi:MAG: hypothetical protein RL261_2122 [Pseudomonadota bacterium]